MCHPFFDELRDPNTRLPDSRHPGGAARDLPNLFDFSRHGSYSLRPNLILPDVGWLTILFAELSIAPALNSRLVPPHARAALEARGLDIDNFTPLTKEEMMARLD
jgi:glycogen synthase kinase 3 beta